MAGFARMDITPEMGIGLSGYYIPRRAEGVLDALQINALALACGEARCVLISLDNCGTAPTQVYDRCRERAAASVSLPADAVFIACTHTHTGPYWSHADDPLSETYARFLEGRIADAASMAVGDLKPARMGTAVGQAPHVAFIRRFRMRDGSIRTNPGANNPDIASPIGEVDDRVNVIRFHRDGGDEIVLVNFADHPDSVGGSKISADWPGFARRKVEKAFDGVRCILFNGAEGDVNHVNVHPEGGDENDLSAGFDDVPRGYGHARHMGNVVAGAVLQVYDKVLWQDVDRLAAAMRTIEVPAHLPSQAELARAEVIAGLHRAGRDDEIPFKGMELTTVVAEAERMLKLRNGPASFRMPLSAVAVGEAAFIGVAGEPFTGIGRALKAAKGWRLVLPCCITNGYEGYFPMREAYDEGGYEARSSKYAPGVAELIISEGLALLDQLRRDA